MLAPAGAPASRLKLSVLAGSSGSLAVAVKLSVSPSATKRLPIAASTGGWFTSLAVEYRDETGRWRRARLNGISPQLNFDNTQWLKGAYIDHSLSLEPVTTRAVRIIGAAGGIERDARNGGGRHFYTAISELAVYPD